MDMHNIILNFLCRGCGTWFLTRRKIAWIEGTPKQVIEENVWL